MSRKSKRPKLTAAEYPMGYLYATLANEAAQELGRLGGSVKSKKKAKSSRANGKKGGRPKKKKVRSQLREQTC